MPVTVLCFCVLFGVVDVISCYVCTLFRVQCSPLYLFLLPNQERLTALMHAAANGHSDCVRLLLESGVDANAVNRVRAILFHFAVSFV
jgi:hypothetical protein